ncbi:DUF1777-domain-containing protein [Suhomyces tanzawaensis NRRL Y-17324]|uniref:DUF1777-domain-containing protein n=1 Tax=Suhomyces tanzawaensis NRRL Y-17324 TaxID=984487 RepID=A0A1E4SH79_9ASCO|nr:DUF1777-domain-containing protein [Suhomyces tanzawaensis NRRL Y-17324]ODV78772.1 DUF1777-domain-containing protein [Suhomyces tanzawaensis NRRL Y-17324]
MDKIKINLPLEPSSRSRSRLPCKSPYLSPRKTNYRERSSERSAEKLQKSTLYKKDNSSLQDLPLLNTSFHNKDKMPQFREDQDGRGRSRDRDEQRSAKQRGDDIAVNNEERRQSVESMDPDMISLMGFGGFGSTKGKHVKGAKGGAIKTDEKTEYRQYMNRNKGFNRPLSPGR